MLISVCERHWEEHHAGARHTLEHSTLIPRGSQAPLLPQHTYNFNISFVIAVLIDVCSLLPGILFDDICSAVWDTRATRMSTLTFG